ncbi:hypothetical protein C5C63_06290 [Rathayibacter sp. AY1B8]|nr:hypothetical protein C5C63_06290 [Rathayibacter sp. AY1B8]
MIRPGFVVPGAFSEFCCGGARPRADARPGRSPVDDGAGAITAPRSPARAPLSASRASCARACLQPTPPRLPARSQQPGARLFFRRRRRPRPTTDERSTVTRSLTRLTLAIGVPYVVALAAIAFWPTPVDAGVRGDLGRVTSWFARHGLPMVDYAFIESTANIALFVPLGLLLALNLRLRRAWVAVAVGAVVSSLIEAGQLLFLSARFATVDDVVMNTSGALLGAVAGVLLRMVVRARRRRRAAEWDDAFAHIPLRGTSGVVADQPSRVR